MNDPYLEHLLGERETIELVTHQHWFQLFRAILLELVLIAATITAVTMASLFLVPSPLVFLGYFLLLIPILSIARDMMVWNNHKYVVTNRRVIQVFGVFSKNVTDSSLEKVNDVKMDQSFLGRMFNFGDIEILTASELGINRFTFIGDPVGFKTAMLNAKFHLEQAAIPSYAPSGAARIADPPTAMDVPRLIEELDALRRKGALTEAEFQEKKSRLLGRI